MEEVRGDLDIASVGMMGIQAVERTVVLGMADGSSLPGADDEEEEGHCVDQAAY